MKIQKYFTISLCVIFVLFFSFWCFFITTPDYSYSERRSLANMPEISWDSIKSGEFAKKFEEYTTDRFPLRDVFRSVKAYTRLNLLFQKENNNIFVKDGHISKIEYPMNEDMLKYAVSLFSKIREKHFKDNEVYFTVVPDKNEFLADLKIDYKEIQNYFIENLESCKQVEIGDFLSSDDYYYTDSHWKQEKIVDVAKFLAQSLGTELPYSYETFTLETPFYGVYAGQSALNVKPDVIKYLKNDVINSLKVTGAKAVYDMSKADSKDPYEFFLSGNQPLVKITNPKNPDGKKLIVFRDSFASSIMPLLAQGFSEVTMIDLRYMNSALLETRIDFSDAKVLFMYSANLLNNSTSMK